MKINLLAALFLFFLFTGCEKTNNCSTDIFLRATDTTPAVGESFTLTVNKTSDNDQFHWSGPGNYSDIYGNSLTVDNADYSDGGWYYCTKTNTECDKTVRDSIFIDLGLKQGTAPCTPTSNSIGGGGIPTTNFYSVTKNFDPTFHGKALHGNASYGYPADFLVLFNSYNGNTEPVDGIYATTDMFSFSPTDPYEYISLSFVYGGQFFHCHPDKDVYVKHVNGKLSATFCNVPFSNGSTIINISGALTEN